MAEQELIVLRSEIATLKEVIKNFQSVPQSMSTVPMISAHPGANYGLCYEVSHTFDKLVQAGVTADIAAEILLEAQKEMVPAKLKNKALVDAWAAKQILEMTKVTGEKSKSKIQFFVGPSGSGKTSTLVKMASHAVINDKKQVAILTTDTFKVGAAEQLKIYAQILNVPFGIIRGPEDWKGLMNQAHLFDQIFIDGPGLSLKSLEENSFLREVLPPFEAQTTNHLVLEATSKESDINEMGKRYKSFGFNDVIFTALDLSVQHGTIFSFMKKFDVPLHSFGIGPRVPEDFEYASKERVLDLIFKLTNHLGSKGKATA